jgi:hypothetical protein
MGIEMDPEFRELISPLTTAEQGELEASLKAEGCRNPLVCWGNLLVDGHHRFDICSRLGIPFKTEAIELPDREHAKEWIITNQLARRNISLYQRARLVMKREEIIAARAKERQRQHGNTHPGKKKTLHHQVGEVISDESTTDRRLAKMADTSHTTIHRARVIEKEASEEVKKNLMEGRTTISREYKQIQSHKKDKRSRATMSKAKRVEMIRDLSGRGFKADQIAEKIGIGIERTRFLARKSGITLIDAVIGKVHKLEVNRIVSKTVMGAQSLTTGLELIDSRLGGLDTSRIDEWIQILSASIAALNRLISQLKARRAINDK